MSLFKRLAQLLRIGSHLHRIRRSRTAEQKLRAQHALVSLLGDARGISMKVGQLFASPDGNSPFQALVDQATPFPLNVMTAEISSALAQPARQVFKHLAPASKAASLGQVHFAELLDGTPVAIKVRYPDIVAALDAELHLAGLMPGLGPIKQWGFDLESYKRQLQANMQRELDYWEEAKRQDYFKTHLTIAGLSIPSVYLELCRPQLLVQSRAYGEPLSVVSSWSWQQREQITTILWQTLFKSLFELGELHADPHAGNYLFDLDPQGRAVVHLLDFGCTVPIERRRRLALLKLILACREHSELSPLDCLVALGFAADKLSHIHGALPHLCQILLRPFLSDNIFNPQAWQIEQDIQRLLGEQRWWFRAAGPADFLLLMRALQGLLIQLQHLQVPLNWWQLLQTTLAPTTFAQARDLDLPVINAKAPSFALQATKLQVEITEHGQLLVNVTLPADAVFELDELIPPDVHTKLQQSTHINLSQLVQQLQTQGVTPQLLFELDDAPKTYKVWLE